MSTKIVEKKYEHLVVDYESEKELSLSLFIQEFSEVLSKIVNQKVNYIWVDFGTVVYDIHIEFATEEKEESRDLYFELTEDKSNLIENLFSKGFDFKENFGEILTKKFTKAIIESR